MKFFRLSYRFFLCCISLHVLDSSPHSPKYSEISTPRILISIKKDLCIYFKGFVALAQKVLIKQSKKQLDTGVRHWIDTG